MNTRNTNRRSRLPSRPRVEQLEPRLVLSTDPWAPPPQEPTDPWAPPPQEPTDPPTDPWAPPPQEPTDPWAPPPEEPTDPWAPPPQEPTDPWAPPPEEPTQPWEPPPEEPVEPPSEPLPTDPVAPPPEEPTPPSDEVPPTEPDQGMPIVSVDPVDGSELASGSLGSITVTFDRAVAPDGLYSGDFLLDRMLDSGQTEPILGMEEAPAWHLEAGGTRLVLRLEEPLTEGEYRFSWGRNSRLTTVEGEIIDSGPVDLVLSRFQVAARVPEPEPAPNPDDSPPVDPDPIRPPGPDKPEPEPTPTPTPTPDSKPIGVTLDQATPLGTIGPEILEVSDSIDLEANPSSIRLYRIELAEGHFWRLGLEVSGDHDPAPMPTRISLFDAQGGLIASSSLGLNASSLDPFLFAGLEPGTYFVGVSSADNDPRAGGYDPATGAVGPGLRSQPGGSFSISLVADPADSPTSVIGVDLDRADPADPVPTGFTLRFDGPVRAYASDLPGGADSSAGPMVEVVDQDGTVWPASAVAYDAVEGSLSLLFLDRLPRGRYEIRLPGSEGLVDLAGLAPNADGMPDGVLGRFEITTEPTSRAPNDLGALLPSRASEGESVDLQLEPGVPEAIRFVVTYETQYKLQLQAPSGTFAFELVGPDGVIPLGSEPTSLNGVRVQLSPGTYSFRILNRGADLVEAILTLQALNPPRDSVPLNGVGQGPALGMRVIFPTAGQAPADPGSIGDFPSTSFAPAPFPVAPGLESSPSSPAPSSELIAEGESGPAMPAGPMLTLDVELLGRPTAQSLRVAAVSPDQGDGLAATASIAEGSELFRAVPIGSGQSIDLPEIDARWSGDPQAEPKAWPAAGQDGDASVVLQSPGSSASGDPARNRDLSEDLVDAVLATLPPIEEPILDDLAMLDAAIVPELPTGGEEPGRGGDRPLAELGADPSVPVPVPVPVPVVQALSLGLLVTWTARRWTRRRVRPARMSGRRLGTTSGCRIEAAKDSAIINDLLRRHPHSSCGFLR